MSLGALIAAIKVESMDECDVLLYVNVSNTFAIVRDEECVSIRKLDGFDWQTFSVTNESKKYRGILNSK